MPPSTHHPDRHALQAAPHRCGHPGVAPAAWKRAEEGKHHSRIARCIREHRHERRWVMHGCTAQWFPTAGINMETHTHQRTSAGTRERMATPVPASTQTYAETGKCIDHFQRFLSWLQCLFIFWYARLAGIFNI